MNQFDTIASEIKNNDWFIRPGAYVLVDGQFGSTGKGALAALFGVLFGERINVVTTNAGPNSGHTGYLPMQWKEGYERTMAAASFAGHDRVITQQIPVLGVVSRLLCPMHGQTVYLNGGAVIDLDILEAEMRQFGFVGGDPFLVHPNAAVIDRTRKAVDSLDKIASTGKGVGEAIATKVLRGNVTFATRGSDLSGVYNWDWTKDVVFVETAQGFSLGINSRFYPYVTSRECTVMQAIADANIPAQMVRKVVMTLRTFPIRVGNTAKGHSGGPYPDQRELEWTDIGVEPEITTVTKRVRRVFTWSRIQFREACAANRPDALCINFLDYLDDAELAPFMSNLHRDYLDVMGRRPDFVLGGYGPRPEDTKVMG